MRRLFPLLVTTAILFLAGVTTAQGPAPIRFNTRFPGASLGKIEVGGEGRYRLHVAGQADERGRNRQASWYFFRMDGVRDRDLVLTLTDFIGEYNDKPGAVPMNADTVPVHSEDGKSWRHFSQMEWDDVRKEATLRIRPGTDTLWIAHQPPYTPDRLARLLVEVDRSPHARVEAIGKTVERRDLHLVTVTDPAVPDAGKRELWLQARQHAWEAGTSYVMEGALQFATSDSAEAAALRRAAVWRFLPMADPDGCEHGRVRFNGNGYDVNRHWTEVDLRSKDLLAKMPEIWYVKKALMAQTSSERKIDLLVNLHNTETAEYVDALAADAPAFRRIVERFHKGLSERTLFHPSRPPAFGDAAGSMTSLWKEHRLPVVLMELRTATNSKLGRRPTVEDRLTFGQQLLAEMLTAVR